MKYTITNNNLHLVDSYKISKNRFDGELNRIRGIHPSSQVWKRKRYAMKLEWATHNGLYALGIKRDHTKDVDINYPQKWYAKIGYFFVGCCVWLFIK